MKDRGFVGWAELLRILAKWRNEANGRKLKNYKGRSEADDPAPREQAGKDARTGILVMERRVRGEWQA